MSLRFWFSCASALLLVGCTETAFVSAVASESAMRFDLPELTDVDRIAIVVPQELQRNTEGIGIPQRSASETTDPAVIKKAVALTNSIRHSWQPRINFSMVPERVSANMSIQFFSANGDENKFERTQTGLRTVLGRRTIEKSVPSEVLDQLFALQ